MQWERQNKVLKWKSRLSMPQRKGSIKAKLHLYFISMLDNIHPFLNHFYFSTKVQQQSSKKKKEKALCVHLSCKACFEKLKSNRPSRVVTLLQAYSLLTIPNKILLSRYPLKAKINANCFLESLKWSIWKLFLQNSQKGHKNAQILAMDETIC